MLNSIKAMIMEKQSMMEAAELITEETNLHHIEDDIVLGEASEEEPDFGSDDMDDDMESGNDDLNDEDGDDETDDDKGDDDHDILDKNTDDDETDDEGPAQDDSDSNVNGPEPSIADNQIDDTDDDLPEPVGAQTDEPISDDNDLLTTEIDLGSNTMKDVLPVPPNNAADAIDDADEQRVDSGFGNGNVHVDPDFQGNPLVSRLQQIINSSTDGTVRVDELKSMLNQGEGYTEAITIGGSEDGEEKNDSGDDSKKTDEDTPPDDNLVTQAVKDKVAESEEDISSGVEDGDAVSGSGDDVKDKLLKKLSSLSKNIEDTKRQIIDSL